MVKQIIAQAPFHKIPKDLQEILLGNSKVLETWNDITPLARNEWICWIESGKREDTRKKKLERIRNDLKQGKRRPCCWPGCIHRK